MRVFFDPYSAPECVQKAMVLAFTVGQVAQPLTRSAKALATGPSRYCSPDSMIYDFCSWLRCSSVVRSCELLTTTQTFLTVPRCDRVMAGDFTL